MSGTPATGRAPRPPGPARPLAACGHAHGREGAQGARPDEVVARADSACRARGERLTPIRADVLRALAAVGAPVGAYDLIERLAAHGGRRLSPISMYRALDFLVAGGFAHRLATLNAFLHCPHGHDRGELVTFLLCERCGAASEVQSPALEREVASLAACEGFAPRARVVELVGRCAACAAPERTESAS